ncbi:condensation domain-containing protein [Nocardia gipuzkoensis]|uniref:condensation domain-containing protein n=1 Tax=Nocardia gipuzkoensis TaxID=2749991 RepID=UPI001E53BE6A|nr:condensation domain-containing protein [Nocardia gipuzkoensis]UGT68401.1 condensation domain-containing protein [Nocardia gipuzkoensis]
MNNSAAVIWSEAIGDGFERTRVRGTRPVVRHLPPPRRPAPLARGPRPAHLPLAPAQERMWHAARTGNSGDWNVARAVRLSGPALRTEALVTAIDDVVARHEPLRTRYPKTASGPAQVIVPAPEARVRTEIVAVTEAELPHRIAEFAAGAFDLDSDLPLRARLCVLGPRDVVLVLVVHHISIDGRSVAPLLRDLVTAYLARQAGAAPDWTPLPVDYADYTLWKHAQLGDYSDEWSRATQQLRYWANTLAGRPPVLEFPCARPRPIRRAGAAGAGAVVPVAFGADVHRALLDRACAARSSLFMVLQAAFAVAVGAFSGSADVTVATAVAGRDHRLLDDLVGNFADDVLMRVRLDRAADAEELLDQVRRVALAAFAHPDTPAQRLKRCLLQDAACPLFQATLILQRGAAAVPAGGGDGGLTVTELDTGVVRAKHDLEFGLVDRYDRLGAPAGVDGVFIYPTALFDRGTAVAFVELFTATVELLAAGYRGPVAPLLTGFSAAPR